jgi:hypothetical protein
MLHICKLAVGVRDVAHLRALQAARLSNDPPLRHQTRNFPRRTAEVIEGGSIYWVISGAMLARQRILDIQESAWDDGSACAALMLDPALILVAGRPIRAFQGWRYLEAADAPPDLRESAVAQGADEMPEAMRRDLRALCLL